VDGRVEFDLESNLFSFAVYPHLLTKKSINLFKIPNKMATLDAIMDNKVIVVKEY